MTFVSYVFLDTCTSSTLNLHPSTRLPWMMKPWILLAFNNSSLAVFRFVLLDYLLLHVGEKTTCVKLRPCLVPPNFIPFPTTLKPRVQTQHEEGMLCGY